MTRFHIKFTPESVTDLKNAIDYYSEQKEGLDNKFKANVRKQLILLKKNPYTRSIRFDQIRFARIEKFPYAIQYSIEPVNNIVIVHAILSDHQDPDTHQRRIVTNK